MSARSMYQVSYKVVSAGGVDRKEEIARSVQLLLEMVDETCASIPYGFGEDDPNGRVGVREGILPDVKMDIFCHMSFCFRFW